LAAKNSETIQVSGS